LRQTRSCRDRHRCALKLSQSFNTRSKVIAKLHRFDRDSREDLAMTRMTYGLLTALLPLAIALGGAPNPSHAEMFQPSARAEQRRDLRCDDEIDAAPFARTDLFFGLSRPGGVITEEDFKTFVDARVTPRFPDGLTVLSGFGQFRNAAGVTIVEGSKLLILLYPRRDPEASRKIEAIRSDYKWQFTQESVLRVDQISCTSF
jgi:hypothetical protein